MNRRIAIDLFLLILVCVALFRAAVAEDRARRTAETSDMATKNHAEAIMNLEEICQKGGRRAR